MSARAESLRRSGKYLIHGPAKPAVVRPANLKELRSMIDPLSQFPPPYRPTGANSSATDCTSASAGTVVDMTAFDNIINIDAYRDTVTVQPGVRLEKLADALSQHGLELAGSQDLMSRTVGGSVAGGCIGPSVDEDGAFLASQVMSMKVVLPDGRLMEIREDKRNLLNAFRLSYGMLGIIYEVTMKVRPIRAFVANHRRCTIKKFAAATENLTRANVGLKFLLMPFRDRVYLDIRRFDEGANGERSMPWKLKDWGESTVLPQVVRSLNRIVPVAGVRYRIIDEISKATQGIVNNHLVRSGSNATARTRSHNDEPNRLRYTTWVFPAADFPIVVQAYVDFCAQTRKSTGFRCDMPTVGFRLGQDRSALLSPSFEEPMFALRAVSTASRGWEDFAIDFADFAQHWGGSPFFNQTRSLSTDHSRQILGSRIDFFRRIRRQIDPDNRLMNPFLSQYFL